VLFNLLSDEGILLISTHDIRHFMPEKINEEFVYNNLSEDSFFPEYEDSLTDTNNYGSTFISENYFHKLLDKAGIFGVSCVRYELLWEKQDLYILSKRQIKKLPL
jgi:hypothetical protein